MSEQTTLPRKQGQRGKDKAPRKKRIDSIQNVASDDNKRKIILHDISVMNLPRLEDINDYKQLSNRVTEYFTLCVNNAVSPTVAGLALALGVDRATLWNWLNGKTGRIKSQECFDLLKRTYDAINTQYEEMLTDGKIIPVSAFFLMKNNHGYRDQTDHVITARQEVTDTEETILERANLLTDGNYSVNHNLANS